jgi:hypothetical protein
LHFFIAISSDARDAGKKSICWHVYQCRSLWRKLMVTGTNALNRGCQCPRSSRRSDGRQPPKSATNTTI